VNKVISLNDITKKEFISQIEEFSKLNDTNSDWFKRDNKSSIINTINEYLHWTIIVDSKDKVIAFAAIDSNRFKKYNCIRLMSRTFYHPDIRRKNIRYEYNNGTAPVMLMLQKQIKYLIDRKETFIMTMEKAVHRGNLEQFFKKCNRLLKHDWRLLPGMYQTTVNSWQNLGVYGDRAVTIPNMSVDEWKLRNKMHYWK
jgi:hypothetical protein